MNTDNEKLNKFITAVNDEIDIKIKEMLEDAENERKAIIENAESEAEEAAEKHFNVYFQKSDKKFIKELSCAELDMKKAVIQHRETLVAKVFDVVEQRLLEFRKTPKYIDMMVKALLKLHISDNAEIFLASDDMKYAEILKKALPSHNISVSASEKIILGGMSVYNTDRGTIIDKTFDLALAESKRAFATSNAFSK